MLKRIGWQSSSIKPVLLRPLLRTLIRHKDLRTSFAQICARGSRVFLWVGASDSRFYRRRYICTTKLSEGKKQPVEPFSSLLQFLAVISGSFREEECSSELRETLLIFNSFAIADEISRRNYVVQQHVDEISCLATPPL